ncbi:winged helix-turn-helix transcriptional regulator [Elizabethkingia miricola]|uniref:winged helix-turn-helix transcriptional regulator n=1 Tax=Elizabethkingia miricola TaxID=172045 RepID=UPI001F44010E|nr:helix-turn-helix domain-containing protein [Elizabethkingia miricola]UIO95970.1 helix-turn-helix transcriptional regulator [Elizabethkingia miricola]WER12757.1 helix-turn-helix domain-containing protein [Elizabethkingia miricola]WGL72932.1 helix-turn-helix domain-containing protein [Elizabethkingia miricola]WNG64729.1 helix-turn-helix transcriptional regulator [Elizabethkingia miricola]
MKKQRTELGPDCKMHLRGVEDTVYLLSGKWKTIIISHLYFAGKMRFMDLKRQLEKVAAKTLSKELKELEMNNLVSRTQNNTMPVTVDYELQILEKVFMMLSTPCPNGVLITEMNYSETEINN